jgi:hypothetical protein
MSVFKTTERIVKGRYFTTVCNVCLNVTRVDEDSISLSLGHHSEGTSQIFRERDLREIAHVLTKMADIIREQRIGCAESE